MSIKLSELKKTPVGGMPPLITVYGIDGIGKTGFALDAPSPAYLPTEPRFGHYEVANLFQSDEDQFKICGSFGEMIEGINSLIEQNHGFRTAVIDSADHLEPLIADAVLQKYPYIEKGDPVHIEDTPGPNARKITSLGDYSYGKGPALALEAWRHLLDRLDVLRREKGMAVIILAHYQIKQEEPADGDPYQQFQIKIHNKAASLLREKSDYVFFAKLKHHTKKVGENSGFSKSDTRKTQATAGGERVLVCQPSGAYTVKSSSKDMPTELPLSFEAVAQYIPYFNNQKGN